MICPACGYENSAEDIYCDDCGAQLKQKNESPEAEYDCGVLPLVAEQIVGERYKVVRIIQSDSDCIIYEVKDLAEEAVSQDEAQSEKTEAGGKAGATRPLGGRRLLLCEFPSEPQKAADIYKPFAAIKNEHVWSFEQILNDEKGEPRYLLGPLAGVSLRDYLMGHKLSPEDIVSLGGELLSALTAINSLGYVYNGISLDSVWINSADKVCLVRFDRAVKAYHTPLQATVIHGYSSPEAYGLEGGMLTRKSDIFSAGALLYYLLTGREVSLDDNAADAFPATLRLKAKALTKVIVKALKRNPDERWLSASEMADALSKCTFASGAAENVSPTPAEYSKTSAACLGRYSIAKKSHVGAVRKINQDAFLELSLSACERDVPTSLHFIGIIDGMGGEAEGDKAASLAVRAIAEELVRLTLPLRNERATTVLLPLDPEERNSAIIERVIKKANQTIFEYACKSPARRGMGCTISCVLLDGDKATFGHVGDTRAYRFARELDQVTTDHSVVGQLVQMGMLTREEARHSPKRSIIYRALGTQPDIEVEVYKRTVAPGEYLMICCDGIWEYYSDEEMLSFFNSNLSPAEICEQLVATCLERGANDNTTVAVIRHL
ncbi:protein phosphatase 2C domain-containing protein [bacterium]|nr:protein phosphatase 2C domain-containing protein [bacterium]